MSAGVSTEKPAGRLESPPSPLLREQLVAGKLMRTSTPRPILTSWHGEIDKQELTYASRYAPPSPLRAAKDHDTNAPHNCTASCSIIGKSGCPQGNSRVPREALQSLLSLAHDRRPELPTQNHAQRTTPDRAITSDFPQDETHVFAYPPSSDQYGLPSFRPSFNGASSAYLPSSSSRQLSLTDSRNAIAESRSYPSPLPSPGMPHSLQLRAASDPYCGDCGRRSRGGASALPTTFSCSFENSTGHAPARTSSFLRITPSGSTSPYVGSSSLGQLPTMPPITHPLDTFAAQSYMTQNALFPSPPGTPSNAEPSARPFQPHDPEWFAAQRENAQRWLSKKELFYCHYTGCGKAFSVPRLLRNHLIWHSDARPFHCPNCKSTFKRNCDVLRHINSTHMPFSRRFACQECHLSWNRIDRYNAHMRSVHSQEKPVRPTIADSAHQSEVNPD